MCVLFSFGFRPFTAVPLLALLVRAVCLVVQGQLGMCSGTKHQFARLRDYLAMALW